MESATVCKSERILKKMALKLHRALTFGGSQKSQVEQREKAQKAF